MANIIMARGGLPDFKPLFCRGDWAEYGPEYNAPHQDNTPPFDSHADAAFGQGYLNLQFPFVPHIGETTAHHWMSNALKKVAVGDNLILNWIPTRAYLDSFYIEATKFDKDLVGVYVQPVAVRIQPDFTADEPGEFTYTEIPEFAQAVEDAGVKQIPLGTPADSDKIYACVKFNYTTNPPFTFGHNIPKLDSTTGKPTGGYDAYAGTVAYGLKIAAGTTDQLKLLGRGNFAVYLSAKVLAFEGSSQIG